MKAVIFDLDGTLYDKSNLRKWLTIGNIFHLRYLKAERYCRRAMMGEEFEDGPATYQEYYRRMADYIGCSVEKVERWYTGRFRACMVNAMRKHFTAYPWVKPLISELRSQGVKIAVLSDYGAIPEKLNALGIDSSCFDAIVVSPEHGGFKPCGKPFSYTASLLSTNPEEIVMVGDYPHADGSGAKSVGMSFVLVEIGKTPEIQ